MRTLAFDSTGPLLTVGAAEGGRVLGRKDSRAERSRSNLLDLLIDSILEEIGWHRPDVEGLGLLTGPGSLTATRLGWATATGWAQAAGIPVAGWTVPIAHRRHLQANAVGAACCIHYRGDTFLLYDFNRPDGNPNVIHLTPDAYAGNPPRFLTGPGLIGHRDSWLSYCGPQSSIAAECDAFVGGDILALWVAEELSRGISLSLTSSPLEYGLPPDFKKLNPT